MHSYFAGRVACGSVTVSADNSVISNSTEDIERTLSEQCHELI